MSSNLGYGAAIDAGSSGSRIYLYQWPKRELASGAFTKVEREAVFSEERTPGVSDSDGTGIDLLEELVSLAKAALPSDVDPNEVPIYLGATAGMRITDSAFEADVMARIRSVLHASDFLFHDDWARTISGEEEGVYDWLVANYLKNDGNFPTLTTSYGALDLGGASTQISFPVSMQIEDQYPLRIDNFEYPLFTQSFLYYGVDQARMQYDSRFASATKSNPCYPAGYKDSKTKVSGASNWEECTLSVAKLFDQPPNCSGEGQRCLGGGGMHQLPIEDGQKFIAMSAFVYTWDFLGLNIGAETEDLNALNAKAQRVCNLTHEQQIARYQRHMELKPHNRMTTKPWSQCFNAAFSYHLLSKGYGMPVSKTPIEIYYDIDGTKVQWALGLMLVEANKLSSIFKEPLVLDIYSDMGSTYLQLLVISMAILIIFAWIPYRLKRSFSREEPCLPLVDSKAMAENFSPRKGK
mmetsp:Transcript_16444/g.35542  ORF Transcript_16444/g.35542 Transcript_16444/m.35542 type:complete len:465 (+) Transcript_16444:145-1539(+)|eukprot:CAMPEP_0172317818 /NCGR_PEP_ID=MMETSP1058-20130122/32909_1 /TAXON_ID=83371 /ORGANISM="Detonula confervacea, Strain CCMP 353" /LENGTH=464 /DNA_ID=CAMNT_0013032461 /DNA_START=62 /DNA_END=1456 /DNA_ORIENTATION=+